MIRALRKTGIDIISDAPFGTHVCLFYKTREDLLDILVPYFKTGLENNEYCMWITSEPLGIDDARTALQHTVENLDEYIKHGQIEIMDYTRWYTRSGKFDAERVLKGWVEKETYAIKRGFDGLRATGNAFWFESGDRRKYFEYEQKVDSVIGEHRIFALCAYFLDQCGASDIMDVVSNHRFALAKRNGKWEAIESIQRKRMEEELKESEQRFRTIFDNNNDGLVVAGIEDKKFLLGNPMMCRMLGYREDELKGLGVEDIHPDEDLPHVLEQFEKQTKRTIAVAENIPVKRKDGSVFYADISSSPITLDKKEYLIGAFRDTTGRKLAEEVVRTAERKYRSLVETTDTGYVILDDQGRVMDANQEYVRLTGRDRLEDIIGCSVLEWTAPYDHERNAAEVRKCVEQGAVRNLVIDYISPAGRKTPIEINATALRTGTEWSILSLCRDVTGRKLAEEAIMKRNEELTGLNKEIERQREQLRILSARLAEAEETERKRLAQELHDQVGQKLSAIGINLNIMLAQMSDEAARPVRPRIDDSLALVNETTECIRSVMADLRPPMLDDYGLLSAINWHAQQIASRAGITVEMSAKGIVPRLPAQAENFLFRIVQEALANAVKHAQATRVIVAVESDDTGTIRLSVTDNGVGFDTSRRNEPNKWGLITMAEHARAIGAECSIESVPGRGTRVIVKMHI